jgi:hypothetical protein
MEDCNGIIDSKWFSLFLRRHVPKRKKAVGNMIGGLLGFLDPADTAHDGFNQTRYCVEKELILISAFRVVTRR